MTEKEIFLKEILAHPQDMGLRLVYADWLEEYGDEQDHLYAEFIRLQIFSSSQPQGQIPNDVEIRLCELAKEDFFYRVTGIHYHKGQFHTAYFIHAKRFASMSKTREFDLYWRNGFIDVVYCLKWQWVQSVKRICQTHPVHSVHLTDAVPLLRGSRPSRQHYLWRRQDDQGLGEEYLPAPIFDIIAKRGKITNKTKREALQVLSDACLDYGRNA